MSVRFHPLAEAEFRRSVRWYGKRSKRVAAAFVNKVLATAELCEVNPNIFPAYDDFRRWAKASFLFRREARRAAGGDAVPVGVTSRPQLAFITPAECTTSAPWTAQLSLYAS